MENIFVENLSPTTTEQDLRSIFEAFGEVLSVTVVTDRDTGGPRGLAFIEMSGDAQAQSAIAALNGRIVDEHRLSVTPARPKPVDREAIHQQMRRHRQHRY
jgi:RNA recognition motif-containing protein